jgi:YbaB/EbfC DNA-binding family protein
VSGSTNWEELNDRISRLSIIETSRDGTVQVRVSASGVLTDLVLKERWHQSQPLAAVAAQVMRCLARAQARIPELLQQAMFEAVGPHDPGVHLVLADARKRFPEPPADRQQPAAADRQPQPVANHQPPPAPGQPRPSARADDDWDERPVMEDIT